MTNEKLNKDERRDYLEVLEEYGELESPFREYPDLQEMLKELHGMLEAIRLPIPPLSTFRIGAQAFKGWRKRRGADCVPIEGWNFIFVNWSYRKEPGDKKLTREMLAHELIHFCHTETEDWHPKHDRQFAEWAQMVEEAYGIRPTAECKDRSHMHNPLIAKWECKDCGCIIFFFQGDENFLKEFKRILEKRPKQITCRYCHSEGKLEIYETPKPSPYV